MTSILNLSYPPVKSNLQSSDSKLTSHQLEPTDTQAQILKNISEAMGAQALSWSAGEVEAGAYTRSLFSSS